MNIKEYSAKSFVVIGEKTKEYKEQLKELGGKYNALLKCGPAWIFPNPRKSDVVLFLNSKGFGEGITPSEIKNNLPAVTELESTFILVMKNLDIKERFTVLEKLISLLKNVDSYKEEEKVVMKGEKKNKKKTPVKTEAVKTEEPSEDSENEPEVEVKKENKKVKGKQVEEDTEDVKEKEPEKKVKTEKKKPKPQKKAKEVSSDSDEEPEKAVPVKANSAKTSKKSPKKVENDSDTSVDDDGVEIKVQPRLLPKH